MFTIRTCKRKEKENKAADCLSRLFPVQQGDNPLQNTSEEVELEQEESGKRRGINRARKSGYVHGRKCVYSIHIPIPQTET